MHDVKLVLIPRQFTPVLSSNRSLLIYDLLSRFPEAANHTPITSKHTLGSVRDFSHMTGHLAADQIEYVASSAPAEHFGLKGFPNCG